MALLKDFPPLPIKCQIISYSLDLFYKKNPKNRLMCGYICFPECDCFFYSVLALLLIRSFMVWTYSHWNQWRSSRLFIESSIVVSLIGWVLPVYYSPGAKPLYWTCSSTEVTRGMWIQYQLRSSVPCSHILLFFTALSQILFSLRIWFPALSSVFNRLFTLYK